MNYAYLHGFASSHKSVKGQEIAEIFDEHGLELHLPNLNHPSFEELSYSGMLEALDAYVAEHGGDEPWRFIGSSMGGYIATRWASLNGERVDRMLLLCPGFDMANRWEELLGSEGLEEWKEDGSFLFFDPEGSLTAVHWELYQDALDHHPPYPEVHVPTLVLHGRHDEIVPPENSWTFVESTDESRLELLDDAHDLQDSVDDIAERALSFFGVENNESR